VEQTFISLARLSVQAMGRPTHMMTMRLFALVFLISLPFFPGIFCWSLHWETRLNVPKVVGGSP
jgi:low affinity Fe/Cu permease